MSGEGDTVEDMVRQRMTGRERREQLISIGRAAFAERGFDGASVEDIAARAGVSKPVVYEHFGGKEGLYAVVIDRELVALEKVVTESLQTGSWRERIEQGVVALLTYVEEETDGFLILVRDSKPGDERSFSTLLNAAVNQIAHILGEAFEHRGLTQSWRCFTARRSSAWWPPQPSGGWMSVSLRVKQLPRTSLICAGMVFPAWKQHRS